MWSLTTVRDGATHNDKLATVQFTNITINDRKHGRTPIMQHLSALPDVGGQSMD
jgi:hypothetical protein